jgi:hypothetical protein
MVRMKKGAIINAWHPNLVQAIWPAEMSADSNFAMASSDGRKRNAITISAMAFCRSEKRMLLE